MTKLLTVNSGQIVEQDISVFSNADKIKVYRSQAFTAPSGFSVMPMDTVSFDTNGLWDSVKSVIRPKKEGYYLCSVKIRVQSTAVNMESCIYINNYIVEVGSLGTLTASFGSCLVYCNGTTDVISSGCYLASSKAIWLGNEATFMDVVGPL